MLLQVLLQTAIGRNPRNLFGLFHVELERPAWSGRSSMRCAP